MQSFSPSFFVLSWPNEDIASTGLRRNMIPEFLSFKFGNPELRNGLSPGVVNQQLAGRRSQQN
jgi:hypothetical protein